MADPLSITGSIIAVLQASSTVIGYLKDVKGGASDRLRVLDEVRNSICLLEILKDRAEDAELRETWGSVIVSLDAPGGPLTQFKETLDLLAGKLVLAGRIKQAVNTLKWPFEKLEIAAILSILERQKSLFNLAIQLDHIRLELHQESQQQNATDLRRNDVISWLSPLNFRIKHTDVLNRWQEGTARKFFIADHVSGSTIIDYLETKYQASDIPIAFLYFDYKKENEQVIEDLLLSIIRQITQSQEVIPLEVQKMYEDHKRRGTRPRLVECSNVLHLVAAKLSRLYLVIDALDECKDADGTRAKLVSELQRLPASAHMLVTSRFTSDLEQSFSQNILLEIRARDEDITTYLRSRMIQEARLSKHLQAEPGLSDEIIAAILERVPPGSTSHRLLGEKQSLKALRLALRALPRSLDDTYADALDRISRQDADDVQVAKKVLSWISFAKRPLSVVEIQHVIATEELESHQTDLEDDAIPDEDVLTAVCVGLVAIDKESALEERFQHFPFLRYAAQHWGNHARGTLDTADTVLVIAFLKDRKAVATAIQGRWVPEHRYSDWSEHYPREAPKLVYAATFGLSASVSYLLDEGSEIEGTGSDNQKALITASRNGHANVVAELLERAANIYAKDLGGETALAAAAAHGHGLVVDQLITAGSNINSLASESWTPLMAAAGNGYHTTVEKLLAAGENMLWQSSNGESAVGLSIRGGHKEVLRALLIAGGRSLFQTSEARTTLAQVRNRGDEDLVREISTHLPDISSQLPFSVPALLRDDNRDLYLDENGKPVKQGAAKPAITSVNPSKANNFNLFKTHYVLGEKIGKGHFAEVFICRHRASGLRYCAKVYLKGVEHNHPEREFGLMNMLHHPNIVSTKDFFLGDDKAYMHNLKIVHRDIKPENILLMDHNDLRIQLCDFGISRSLANEEPDSQGNICAALQALSPLLGVADSSPRPMLIWLIDAAPEILEDYKHRRYSHSVDIWSAGVVLYICLCGFPPFSDELNNKDNLYTLTQQIKLGRFDYLSLYWDSVGDLALDLIDRMLTVDVEKRYVVEDCLGHLWMTGKLHYTDISSLENGGRIEGESTPIAQTASYPTNPPTIETANVSL
ncbi:uncharacterized protein PAC_19920 [Phialocephala subalpina]|uniref:Protein kinase domain-containing protein n=1 Tax=Phialocephala subalpina TaxID=576137 RepID=A0A1L7XYD5_9HELO|nr:uncharacterized protein PAC_19920 [Phialocephala subalpina]